MLKNKKNKKGSSEAGLHFKTNLDNKTIVDCFNFIECDCLDTYNHLLERKWNSLDKKTKKKIGSKKTYLENTNIAIATLCSINLAFINEIKRLLKKAKKNQNKLKALTIEQI